MSGAAGRWSRGGRGGHEPPLTAAIPPPGRWLRLQGTLKEHHEALQLALEVAAFLQQAEALLGAIHAKVAAPGRVARRREGPRGARAGGQSQGSKRGWAGGI